MYEEDIQSKCCSYPASGVVLDSARLPEAARSPRISPSSESPEASGLTEWTGRWWVLHTKPRQEKALQKSLETDAVRCFLPVVRRPSAGRDRSGGATVPLFPSYLFLCGSDADRLLALRTQRVAHVLDVPDQAQLRTELGRIDRIVSGDHAVELFPGLKQGTRCRILSGSLSGLEGVVLRRQGPWCVYVGVTFLGQSAELRIEADCLAVLD